MSTFIPFHIPYAYCAEMPKIMSSKKVMGTKTWLHQFNDQLLCHSSATLVLQKWCQDYHSADAHSVIVAEKVPSLYKAPTAEVLQLLDVHPTEHVEYRRVSLKCVHAILSEADNWYIPERLTPSINYLLDNTDTPFGTAVRSLHLQRKNLEVKWLWPDDFAVNRVLPLYLLEHKALLLHNQQPVSLVVEEYRRDLLCHSSNQE